MTALLARQIGGASARVAVAVFVSLLLLQPAAGQGSRAGRADTPACARTRTCPDDIARGQKVAELRKQCSVDNYDACQRLVEMGKADDWVRQTIRDHFEKRDRLAREAQDREQQRLQGARDAARRRIEAEEAARRGAGGDYNGRHSTWVHRLLRRVGPWSCPTSPPRVKEGICTRDGYIDAAAQHAWAAQCQSKAGESAKAEAEAIKMMEYLGHAKGMCSSGSGGGTAIGGSSGAAYQCSTMEIASCSELP